MLGIDPRVRALLEAQDWEEIAEKLALYASFKVQKAYWRGKGNLPKGLEIEDLAYNAINAVWTGQRQWESDKEPDPLKFLKGIIDSEVSHLLESSEYLMKEHSTVGDGEKEDRVDTIPDVNQDPAGDILAKEAWDYLKQAASDDYDMQVVLYCLEEGISKRTDIIKTLQCDPVLVDNKLKKIRRYLKKFFEDN